jgi:hypothetical protein
MKAKPAEGGIAKHEGGFQRVSPGWHIFKVEEGIGTVKASDKTKEEGSTVVNGERVLAAKNGNPKIKIPLRVDDADAKISEDHGLTFDIFVFDGSYKDRDEQFIADILGAVGLAPKFEKKWPGEVSVFQEDVMGKIKTEFPGQFFLGRVNESPNKKDPESPFLNLVGIGPMKYATEKGIKELDELLGFKEKAAGKASTAGAGKTEKAAAAAVDDESF